MDAINRSGPAGVHGPGAGQDASLPDGRPVTSNAIPAARRCQEQNTELPNETSRKSGSRSLRRPARGVHISIKGARRVPGGIYLEQYDAVFSTDEVRNMLDRLDYRILVAPRYVFDRLHDIDQVLGSNRDAATKPVLQAAALISRQSPDDRQALSILLRALPGADGKAHKLVKRVAAALSRWRRRERQDTHA